MGQRHLVLYPQYVATRPPSLLCYMRTEASTRYITLEFLGNRLFVISLADQEPDVWLSVAEVEDTKYLVPIANAIGTTYVYI